MINFITTGVVVTVVVVHLLNNSEENDGSNKPITGGVTMTEYEMNEIREEVMEAMVEHRVLKSIKEGDKNLDVVRIRATIWNEVVEAFSTKVMKKYYK